MILVLHSDNERTGQQQAFVARSWLATPKGRSTQSSGLSRPTDPNASLIEGSSWTFNGTFQNIVEQLPIGHLPSTTEAFNITDLTLYPLEYAGVELKHALRARGEMFWRCRWKNYVYYVLVHF